MKARYFVLGMTLAATAAAAGNQPLAIKVSPAMSFAPANLVIRTSVEPDAGNRSLEVIADSGAFYRASGVTLEGDRAPKTTQFEFRSLPPGEYEVTVVVTGADGRQRAVSRGHAKVMESAGAH
jgi:streptogramin lyase